MNDLPTERRRFLGGLAAMSAAAALNAQTPSQGSGGHGADGMIYRTLGSTGEKVSAIGLGGSHIGKQAEEKESIQIIRSARRSRDHVPRQLLGLQRGCERNPHGQSAPRRLPAESLPDDEVRRAHERSRRRSKSTSRCSGCRPTTSICCSSTRISGWKIRIASSRRAARVEALVEAKKAGKIRYIGFTGHKDPRRASPHAGDGAEAQFPFRYRADAD